MLLIWREDTDPSVCIDATLDTYMQLENFRAEGGQPVQRPFPPSTVKVTSKPKPPDFFYAGPVPIVSGKLKDVFEDFAVKAEYIEVGLIYHSKEYTKETFYYFNILDVVECLDRDRSQYTMTEYGADGIEELVVDESKTTGHHLFRIGQIATAQPNSHAVREIIYCASEELATQVIQKKLTGMIFVEPAHWRDYPPRNVAWTPVTR